jgi:hypothetical protein
MSDALANLMNRSSPEAFFGIVISVGGAFLVAIVAIIVGSWSQVRRREMDTSLKQEMLARGMSAEEIERVLSAGSASAEIRKWWSDHRPQSNLGSRN